MFYLWFIYIVQILLTIITHSTCDKILL